MTPDAQAAAEAAVRASYGRLVAYLAYRWRDVAAAEDALADALESALLTWPRQGVPRNPEGWLMTAAKRNLLQAARHSKVERDPALAVLFEQDEANEEAGYAFPDERLKLLFVCAHPAIDATARTPLMLQSVLGLDAARIASAFLVAPATLSQRLVRAKARIRDTGLRFEVPEAREWPERLAAVLEAIYAAYGSGWDDVAGADPRRRGLAEEAIVLARMVSTLLPDEPEAHGLLALILHCEARRDARRDSDGAFVPLSTQDTRKWSRDRIAEAERELALAARLQRSGPFQLEAAIQSAHAQRGFGRATPYAAIAALYEALVAIAPTIGALVGRAAAIAEAQGPEAACQLLAELSPAQVRTYQPYWVLKAHLAQRLGRRVEAAAAFQQAIGLAEDEAIRTYLRQQRDRGHP